MKYLHLGVAALFLLAAYWQFNDPDPMLWVAIYGITAYVAIRHFIGGLQPVIALIPAVLIFVWWCTYVPSFIGWVGDGMPTITGEMKAESVYVEHVREFLGLLLAWVTLAVYAWRARLKNRPVIA